MDYRFASLTPDDEASIALHLLSLDAEDRALRFGVCVSDTTLSAYVQNLNFNRDVAEGAWEGGRLVGFAHLSVYPERGYPVGELGLSVRRENRRQQIGSRLLEQAIVRARRYRLTRLDIHFMRRNLAMARLARRFGLRVIHDSDEARASIQLLPPEESTYAAVHRLDGDGRLEVFKNLASGRPRGHVLLVHGAGGDGWQWRGVMTELAAAGYAAHALSLSGHGGSAPGVPGFAQLFGDLRRVLAELPDHTRLVGHSLGGYLVQRELAESPRPAAVLLAPVPPDVPRGQELATLLAGLSGEHARQVAASVLADAAPVLVERVSTPITLISGDHDRVIPVPWMRATARRYHAPWKRLAAGHNLPVAPGIVPLLRDVLGSRSA